MSIDIWLGIISILLSFIGINSFCHYRDQRIILEAIAEFQQKRDSTHPYAQVKDLLDSLKYDEAQIEIQRLMNIKENDPALYWWLGKAHYKQQNYQEAKSAFEKSIELEPSYQSALEPYLKQIELQGG